MPRPKYYCDYCDKSFSDTGNARKKHIESKVHSMMVKLYYDSLKGTKSNLQFENIYLNVQIEPSELFISQYEVPCKSFAESGTCQFGNSCRYSHSPLFFPFKEMLPLNETIKARVIANDKPLPSGLPPSMIPPPSGGYDISMYSCLDWGWKR